jgi:Domain of unknown function (DUF222)
MSVVVDPPAPGLPGSSPQERAWAAAEATTVAVMGTVNAAMAKLVAALRDLLAIDGWVGWGIQSPEHWVCWKANVSRGRAEGLVRVARRAGELPECWALFQAGRIGEDAMVRIARRVPADRDMDVAALAPELLVSQLDRLLRSLPELPDPHTVPKAQPERTLEMRNGRDGWLRGRFCLPADEGALVQTGLTASRDAEFRDRNGLDDDVAVQPDAPEPDGTDGQVRRVSWADGLVRMAAAAVDALDRTLQRTGAPGDRHQIVVHHDVDPDGSLGPGQLEFGSVIPDWMARYLGCDAKAVLATYAAGRLVGLHPTERRPTRAMRRYLARRDQGCTHPLCHQRRWLHAHHILFWEDGGVTLPENLALLCPAHHRALHRGEFTIEGNPEAGMLRFRDRFGRLIVPPGLDPPAAGPPDDGPDPAPPHGGSPGGPSPGAPAPDDRSPPYAPPTAEPVHWRDVSWN